MGYYLPSLPGLRRCTDRAAADNVNCRYRIRWGGRSRRLFRLLACSACVRGQAFAPGLFFRLARMVAGPEQRFAAGQPVAERVAAVAAAGAADQALVRRPRQPALQGAAVGRVAVPGPDRKDPIARELVGGMGQD
jgi:hypothetical protein